MSQTATFSMGCFWGPQDYFDKIPGVIKTRVGYSGGYSPSPSYHDLDGHSESVEITFDQEKISFKELLEHFWKEHNPTIKHGTQYQSIIFYNDEKQKKIAEESLTDAGLGLDGKILTKILPAQTFHPAEEYHQRYMQKLRDQG